MTDVAARLEELRDRGLYRRLRLVEGPQGPRVTLSGREVLLLCSNDYLGLAADRRVREAAAEAALRWGAGAGASRLISGTMQPHRELEAALAAFKGYDRAILFGSGYLANTGTIAALAGPGEVVFSDELNHASIIDGCRLSRAETVVYRHNDVDHLESLLRSAPGTPALIVTDGIFSMDGDVAPLAELLELAHRYGARLMVDEAHATGALGPGGRGSVSAAGLSGEVDMVMGTMGKALGSYGAYVCADEETVDFLVNRARPFVFSTAPAPPIVGAALAALGILEAEPERVDRLRANAMVLREGLAAEGFRIGDSTTQIVPTWIGEAEPTMALCERALERGVFAQGIRPPTVPEGSSRLRFTVMATHDPEDLRRAAREVGAAAREIGLIDDHRRPTDKPVGSHAFGDRSGPGLVLVHDRHENSGSWLPAIDCGLGSTGRHLIAADLSDRGPVGSGQAGDVAAWGTEVVALVEKCMGWPSAVVGHGIGGLVALSVAARLPGLITGLVLLDTLIPAPCELEASGGGITSELAQLSCPIAMVYGEKCARFALASGRRAESGLGRPVSITIVPGVDHSLLSDRPGATAGAVAGALAAFSFTPTG